MIRISHIPRFGDRFWSLVCKVCFPESRRAADNHRLCTAIFRWNLRCGLFRECGDSRSLPGFYGSTRGSAQLYDGQASSGLSKLLWKTLLNMNQKKGERNESKNQWGIICFQEGVFMNDCLRDAWKYYEYDRQYNNLIPNQYTMVNTNQGLFPVRNSRNFYKK